MHEDAPDELVHDLFNRCMWTNHPLGRPVLGFNETVGKVTRDQVAAYWRERYSPNNMVVAAAGNVEHDSLVEEVDRLFADGSGRKTLRSGDAPQPAGGLNVFRRPTEQAHIVMGTQGLHRSHDDRHALALVDTVLGGGMSSRLFQEVRERRGLAYSVYSYRSLFADTGSFSIYAGTTPQNAETVMDIFRTQIDSLVADGITSAEFQRAKGHVKGALVLSSEDPGSRMNQLGRQQLTSGEILSINELIDRFERLEMDDIRRVIDEVFDSGEWQTTVVGPFDEGAFDKNAA